jgi:hypothetical protein
MGKNVNQRPFSHKSEACSVVNKTQQNSSPSVNFYMMQHSLIVEHLA